MAILKNRIKTSNDTTKIVRLSFIFLKRSFTILLIVVCLLLINSPKDNEVYNIIADIVNNVVSRSTLLYDKVFSLIYKVADNITYLKDLKTENENLKHQLSLLEKLKSENQAIEHENVQLRKLLDTIPDPACSFVTARLISVVNNPFISSVLIAAGTNQGIKINQLVTNDEGLVGRIIKQTNNYSKVMTITDIDSHIPIITSITRERGILAGYNTGAKIIHLPKNHSAKIGEKITTSGDGNIYPYGINVAKIVEINDSDVLVEPIVNLSRVEFVNVCN